MFTPAFVPVADLYDPTAVRSMYAYGSCSSRVQFMRGSHWLSSLRYDIVFMDRLPGFLGLPLEPSVKPFHLVTFFFDIVYPGWIIAAASHDQT